MPQTYAQLQKQIAALESQAEELRRSEMTGVIAKIKDLIANYGISPNDIFGRAAGKGVKTKPGIGSVPPAKKTARKGRKGAGKVKYSNGQRNWTGFGPQPGWLKSAIAGRKSLEDFQV